MKFCWSFMLKTRTSQHKWSEQGHVHGHWEQGSLHFNSDCTETRRAFWACPTEANRQARDYCPAWFYLLIFHPAPRVWVAEQCTSHTQHHLLDWSLVPHSRCQPLWGQQAVLEVVAGALWALFQPCCNVCSESSSSPAASPCPCWAEVSWEELQTLLPCQVLQVGAGGEAACQSEQPLPVSPAQKGKNFSSFPLPPLPAPFHCLSQTSPLKEETQNECLFTSGRFISLASAEIICLGAETLQRSD